MTRAAEKPKRTGGARRPVRSPHVIAVLNDRWRVIDDPLQWILQRRRRNKTVGKRANAPAGEWEGSAFCVTKTALIRNVQARSRPVDPAALEILEALPERHPHPSDGGGDGE
jgi:hypothetical protein